MIFNFVEIKKKKITLERALKFSKYNWKTIVIILTPILFLPLTFTGSQPMLCGYIIAVVGTFWVTEVMHIAVTSLIPIVLFPIFGILDPITVATCYMKDITLMLLGGLIVAKTIERQNLHKRLALHILQFMGPNLIFQYLGFMFSTWFISMWINNSSTTAMMTTLAVAVSQQWMDMVQNKKKSYSSNISSPENPNSNLVSIENIVQNENSLNYSSTYESEEIIDQEIKKMEYVSKGLFLSIAYSATCGGMATIAGTVPNYIFYNYMDTYNLFYPFIIFVWIFSNYGPKLNLNFATFMFFSFPMSLLIIILCWLLLVYRYIGIKEIFNRNLNTPEDDKIMKTIKDELSGLGSVSFGEISTFCVFIGLVLLWILREPGFPLLSKLFTYTVKGKAQKFWTDGISSVVATIFVFNLPATNPFKIPITENSKKLMSWNYIESGFSWGIVFLFGGGFAIAEGCVQSGLSKIIGSVLASFTALPHFIIILIVSCGISFLTEVTSNTVTITIMLPILVDLAECIHMHPLRMGLAVALSSSFSFCLPAATPPNAIVLSTGRVKVIDMLTSGFMLNIICIIVLSVMAYYFSCPIFGTDIFPEWIKTNCTNINE